ncbi:hypothetical protein N3K66_008883 [Trichothecium roseum]|uniref:Uncharacterized protein n=1 Tax=Trichothecium roseum TaxID=47278 RepID=A0ACC0URG6_9HYPO|nr:hypothetical protein N3K66_008883 [Trichothecium roseum]
MSTASRIAPLVRTTLRPSMQVLPCRSFSVSASRGEEWPQRTPMGAYYESIINKPSPYPFKEKPEEPPSSADPEVPPEAKKPAAVEEPSKPTKKKPGRRSSSNSKSAVKEESLKKAATAAAAASSPAPSKATSPPSPSPPPATAQEKARIVFGTRLAGPDDKSPPSHPSPTTAA